VDRTKLIGAIFRIYYFLKFYPFRNERALRRRAGLHRGFVGIQIDGLSHPHLKQALKKGYLPNIARHLKRGYVLREYMAGLPSSTPAAQAAIFYGDDRGIPAFRWFDKAAGKIISCNDPDHVQYFRERLFENLPGLLAGGSSYSNILDGGAARSIFTVSSPHPQTLFGRFGGPRFLLLIVLHPLRICRMMGASVIEYFTEIYDRRHFLKTRPWRLKEGLFPFIRIFCNVILRELQTFGVIADVYAGVPAIYTTYSGYDELAHHFGPESLPAMKNLKYTDMRIGEIMRMLRHAPGACYELVVLSDHGQTPGYPFENRFGRTLGETVNDFLQNAPSPSVSFGELDFTRVKLNFLREELESRQKGWRYHLYRMTKRYMQKKIDEFVPETTKVDMKKGMIITYSSTLAHLYLTGVERRLCCEEIEERHPGLITFLIGHEGIGFIIVMGKEGEIRLIHGGGESRIVPEGKAALEELDFLKPFGPAEALVPELQRFASGPFCGDIVIFGAYDGTRIACFDNQVGGHGSAGGEQSRPFLILPGGHPLLKRGNLSGYGFLYRDLFSPLLHQKKEPTP